MSAKTVVVAMSGGVDSSVAAALLKDQGFKVIGLTMQVGGRAENNACCGLAGIEDARRVAARLGIPHYLLNFREIFKQKVIADFCAEYQQGRTPNPCVRCNQYIKFDYLLKKARQLNADYIATGHYARIEFSRQKKKFLLKKGLDLSKDQSYVLYTLTQKQLARILMPLGRLTKQQVRKIARAKGLPVAEKAESQEICFIPDNDYAGFLKGHGKIRPKPGPIKDSAGRVIGQHQGIIHYTIGQRKGIGIASQQPLYVIAINKEENSVMVGTRPQACSRQLTVSGVNLIYLARLAQPIRAQVKVRYQHQASWAKIYPLSKHKANIKFSQPQFALTPGQSAVFYNKDIVIGGGLICLP